ncbi:MAG TPA: Tim44/TimA family putative adaptor protein [Candidatus Cybelea sp.]|nr:Tim44/TimA family putative adaptor protein [Candidatus Cybelea sp.]
MNDLDLIIFAVLAVFLGWKLYSVLGRRTGNERSIDPFATPPKPGSGPAQAPSQGGGNGAKPADASVRPVPRPEGPANDDRPVLPREQRQLEAVIAQAPEPVKKGLEAIKAADPEFDSVAFLAGAKIAFDMILNAFAAGDANGLKPLLAPEVLQHFTSAINERQKRSLTLKTTLVGIVGQEVLEAEMKGPDARIKVKFVSQQVNVTQDSEGRIVEGHPNEVATITDIWTFSRPVTARDPNWLLIATESPH